MRREGEKSQMEQATVPKELVDVINGEFNFRDYEQWAKSVSQEALKMLDNVHNSEEFQRVLDLIKNEIGQSDSLKSIGGQEITTDELCAPVYRNILVETVQKYRFHE